MNDLTIIGRGVATFTAGVNPFEACFRLAKPALDAVVALRKPLAWLGQYHRPLLDVARTSQHRDQAVERCELIPKEPEMCRARELFEQAEREPAPIEWVHIAIALMLDSEPGAQHISDGYRHSVIDSLYEDPETWGEYGPGYSAPVIVRAIREARRQGGLPSPGKFVALCGRNREWFRRGQTHIDDLIEIRRNAEDVLIQLDDDRVADLCRHEDDEDWDIGSLPERASSAR
jgi:hypothetical protein